MTDEVSNAELGLTPKDSSIKQPVPNRRITEAQSFFKQQGFQIDSKGFIDIPLADPQIAQLHNWSETTSPGGIEMPTEEEFHRKTLLALSLWPQEENEKINYLFGRGIGAEVALRGVVQGRERRIATVPPYRSHSDFDLYGVDERHEWPDGTKRPYTQEFVAVFGNEETYPSTKTKALEDIPLGIMHQTAETVDLDGLRIRIPELEILFLDKYLSPEYTPRPEGTDAELIAGTYELDRKKTHDYLERFHIIPRKALRLRAGVQEISPMLEGFVAFHDLPHYAWIAERCKNIVTDLDSEKVDEAKIFELYRAINDFFSGTAEYKAADVDTDGSDLISRWINDAKVKKLQTALEETVVSPVEKLLNVHKEIDSTLDKAA